MRSCTSPTVMTVSSMRATGWPCSPVCGGAPGEDDLATDWLQPAVAETPASPKSPARTNEVRPGKRIGRDIYTGAAPSQRIGAHGGKPVTGTVTHAPRRAPRPPPPPPGPGPAARPAPPSPATGAPGRVVHRPARGDRRRR